MAVNHVRIPVDIPATTGVGSTTLSQPLEGKLLAVGLNYHASADAGTDVVVSVTDPAGPVHTLLTVSNNKTDGWYYPRAAATTSALVAITNSHVEIPFAGYLSVAVADGGASALAPCVTADIYFED